MVQYTKVIILESYQKCFMVDERKLQHPYVLSPHLSSSLCFFHLPDLLLLLAQRPFP